MKAYSYTAYTGSGRKKTGTIVAETQTHATQQLATQDLFVSDLTETRAAGAKTKSVFGPRSRRLGPDLQAVFTRQMAVMLGAELPVDAALEAVRTGGHPALESVAARTRADLLDGGSLSWALEESGAGFPPYYFASLRAGEEAGELSTVFSELADHLEELNLGKAQIATALIYPAFVAAVSLLVCGILMVNVAPEIVSMFEMTGRDLPPITVAVLMVSDAIIDNWVVIAIGLFALLCFALAVPRVEKLRRIRDRVVLKLPVLGRLARMSEAVQYMRTLALVLGSRHAVLSAVDSAASVLTAEQFQTEGQAVSTAVRQGQSLASALEELSFLPPVARQLISAGEISVRLARMTDRAAALTEHRLLTERKRIAALLEPLLMMVVGALVLVVVLAVLLPVFDLQAVVAG
ncbi:type II secretion system F family protein [Pelagimonas varians]|uniref:Type II secretion system protein F n=1 Tax=Pelagimonas varians TaxID=696760 RepID=A0A238L0X7_9RHOB|nr:type II secretion system F family protein [Pelagimonas varians]PYG27235.1 type II secretion system protein F (GspF) [Pelagimonas varians]SMX48669.1 Type II secretion system protein F [Pelagimonas varians]